MRNAFRKTIFNETLHCASSGTWVDAKVISEITHATRFNIGEKIERVHLARLNGATADTINNVTSIAGRGSATHITPCKTNSARSLNIKVIDELLWHLCIRHCLLG
jgi:hypothetical protein